MTGDDSLTRLLSELELGGIRLGLGNVRALLAALGEPQRRFASVLVAGTNGKGSTAALLAAATSAAGYRTGLYTSPHLESVEERLRLDGAAVPRAALAELLPRVVATSRARLAGLPTYFEALTAAALVYFAERQVELAVLEVGMGGRLDATNAVEPELSLVTTIDLDHREHLGTTLGAIAREKAGILRRGRPAYHWAGSEEADSALVAVARELDAPLVAAESRAEVAAIASRGWEGQRITPAPPRGGRVGYEVALLGTHQARNLALAVLGGEALAAHGFPRLEPAAIARGVASCRWPGRLEPVGLDAGGRVLLDAAHNPGGVRTLLAFLAERGEPYDLLFGVLADKEVDGMLPPLVEGAERVTLTAPTSARALPAEALARHLPQDRATAIARPAEALGQALATRPRLLVVCGSIVLVGELRAELRRRYGVPPAPTVLWAPPAG